MYTDPMNTAKMLLPPPPVPLLPLLLLDAPATLVVAVAGEEGVVQGSCWMPSHQWKEEGYGTANQFFLVFTYEAVKEMRNGLVSMVMPLQFLQVFSKNVLVPMPHILAPMRLKRTKWSCPWFFHTWGFLFCSFFRSRVTSQPKGDARRNLPLLLAGLKDRTVGVSRATTTGVQRDESGRAKPSS
jgi:hypothetical protein